MFVQVIEGKAKDAAAFRKWGKEHEGDLKRLRPDLIGGIDVYEPDGSFVSVAYFTSEAEARKNEKGMAEDPMMAEYMSHMAGEMEFLDITDPDID